MTAITTASIGQSLVRKVWRALEPCPVSTNSPSPASTRSTATKDLPISLPKWSVCFRMSNLLPLTFGSLMVEMAVPTTLAINMIDFLIGLCGNRQTVYFLLCRLFALHDLDTSAGANTGRAGLNHASGLLKGMHATGGLDTHFRSNYTPHKGHILDGGASSREASGSFDVICPSLLSQQAGRHFLLISQQGSFNDHLYNRPR